MEHPISELMQTAMSSMKDMVDVNTVVGHPVQASSCLLYTSDAADEL